MRFYRGHSRYTKDALVTKNKTKSKNSFQLLKYDCFFEIFSIEVVQEIYLFFFSLKINTYVRIM
jgi:hypothetical protein